MTFLKKIFERLKRSLTASVLVEVRGEQLFAVTGAELLDSISRARGFLRAVGLKKGDRCALLAPNSIRWAALDLAMMSEGIIVVPLYARQIPAELAAMVRDSGASRVCCGNEELRRNLLQAYPQIAPISIFEEIFAAAPVAESAPKPLSPADPVTIIYTSGTSGEPKGVVLVAGNFEHILVCTTARLDQLMGPRAEPDQVFHYGPFGLAASRVLLLSCLLRNSVLSLSTDLTKLADEIRVAAPNYFLNVPILLERMRRKIEEQIRARGGWIAAIFSKARRAYLLSAAGDANFTDRVALAAAKRLIFPAIRKALGPQLKALICGSAPLAAETQNFFMMLGIAVLQVYGLTETTAICTMDNPFDVTPGRVGPAIPGTEMTLGENSEILVRGPNIFAGYWQRPEATAKALEGGWLHTGDQGEVDASGNWRIIGRVKNLIILNSGHNIAPEPLEEKLAQLLPGAQQVMVVGNDRSYLAALVAGHPQNGLSRQSIETALAQVNSGSAHYKQIRAFHTVPEPFTIESGLLTANGKLRRDAILTKMKAEIEAMYRRKEA